MVSGCASETQLAAHVVKNFPVPGRTQPASKSSGNFKVGTPYKVAGRHYTPKETYSHSETGIASWYGPGFDGKKTANGEIFNQNDLTAAHKTLQMPSLVRVTNLENGRSIVVRVNDRGPFSKKRIIDVSKRSAELLGFKNQGTAKVRIDVLSEESRKVAHLAKQGIDTRGSEIAANERPVNYSDQIERVVSPAVPVVQGGSKIFVQAASFGNHDNAIRFARSLADMERTAVETVISGNRTLYRVRLGPLETREKAEVLTRLISERGHDGSQIVVD